jgi:hypothetical protein
MVTVFEGAEREETEREGAEREETEVTEVTDLHTEKRRNGGTRISRRERRKAEGADGLMAPGVTRVSTRRASRGEGQV